MVEAVAILSNEQYLKLINPFCGQSLFEYQGVPRKEAKTGLKVPEKSVPFRWIEVSLPRPSFVSLE